MMNTAVNFFKALNNRELAIAIWIFIAIIWCISISNIRNSFFHVIKSFFAWKLSISYLIMFTYISIIVLVLASIGIWNIKHLPITILWGVCVAFIMLFNFSKANNPRFFKDSLKDNLNGLIILVFLINLYVFDLWIELILVPMFGILGGMIALAETDTKYELVKKLLNSIMVLIGLFFIGYALYMMVTDFKHFAIVENLEKFYLPILLSIMFLPFVYFAALFAGYETFFIRLQFFIQDAAVLRYAKKKTLFAFNINLWQLNKWSEHVISSWRFKKKNEVDEAITGFKNAAYSNIKHK